MRLRSTETLIVWGEEDQLTPLRHTQIFLARIPRARLVPIEGAGLFPQKEKPHTGRGESGLAVPHLETTSRITIKQM